MAARAASAKNSARLATGAGHKGSRGKAGSCGIDDPTLLRQTLTSQPVGIAINVAGYHFADNEWIDVKPVEKRSNVWRFDGASYCLKERPLTAAHGGQRSAPCRSDQSCSRDRPRAMCGVMENVGRSVPRGHNTVRSRNDVMQ